MYKVAAIYYRALFPAKIVHAKLQKLKPTFIVFSTATSPQIFFTLYTLLNEYESIAVVYLVTKLFRSNNP